MNTLLSSSLPPAVRSSRSPSSSSSSSCLQFTSSLYFFCFSSSLRFYFNSVWRELIFLCYIVALQEWNMDALKQRLHGGWYVSWEEKVCAHSSLVTAFSLNRFCIQITRERDVRTAFIFQHNTFTQQKIKKSYINLYCFSCLFAGVECF